jgi:hypothetical protein
MLIISAILITLCTASHLEIVLDIVVHQPSNETSYSIHLTPTTSQPAHKDDCVEDVKTIRAGLRKARTTRTTLAAPAAPTHPVNYPYPAALPQVSDERLPTNNLDRSADTPLPHALTSQTAEATMVSSSNRFQEHVRFLSALVVLCL